MCRNKDLGDLNFLLLVNLMNFLVERRLWLAPRHSASDIQIFII